MARLLAAAVALGATVSAAAELRLELVRDSLTGTHCRYREFVDGVASDAYVTLPCSASAATAAQRMGGVRRDLRGNVYRREIVEESPLRPFAYDYDAATGALLRRIPLYFQSKPALVFDPNPVAALNAPWLRDENDAASAVPAAAYEEVELRDVASSGPLRGPYVALIDRQPPHVAPPDASGPLLFDRADDGFEDVHAYFHIDRNQRYLQSIGYRGTRAIAPYAIEVDAHASGGLDASVFIPAPQQPGRGTLFFGTGGTDDAEDADLLVHEYGHAILEWISPGTFGGAFASQARAISEGFGDYWAFSSHYAERIASGRDPFCFADWDARCWTDLPSENCIYPPGSDCLRRLDSPRTMADYDTLEAPGSEHRNGLIWSSALREIFLALGRHVTDTIVIESLFGAPVQPTFAVMARRMIDADRLLYGGAHAPVLCAAMVARGILPGGRCTIVPRGELTIFQSGERAIPIPEADPEGIVSELVIGDARAIESLFVRVDIAHPSRGDLRIELIAPDGTVVLLQQSSSFERGRDVRVTFGLDAAPAQPLDVLHGRSAAGVWRLRVADQRLRDVGVLLSWGLVIQFAGDAPATERPRGERTQMIPAVAHRHGANETFFASDLRIANVGSSRQTATLVFTPSGENGLTSFAAARVSLEPGQTVAFDDVLQSVFAMSGSGSLEILGDVIAMSRTYTRALGGTVGQQIPPVEETTSAGERPLFVAAFPDPGHRYNAGFVETAGASGTISVNGSVLEIPPFSHVQFPAPATALSIAVLAGTARVGAYISQVDNASGDAMFVPARAVSGDTREESAPAAHAFGVLGTFWRSDLWLAGAATSIPAAFADALAGDTISASVASPAAVAGVLPAVFGRSGTLGALTLIRPPGVFAGSRIASARTSQFIPFRAPTGPREQHLLFIESSPSYRTNIGITTPEAALAQVIVYDASGTEIASDILFARALAQMAVTTPVTGGRAVVRFLSGGGQAYASLIDNASGDATFVEGR